jgi:nucleoside-diphosphate-sugar epimerase
VRNVESREDVVSDKLILVTGATGKVGQTFIRRLLASDDHGGSRVRALCHNRTIDPTERVEVVKGSIEDPAVVERAVDGATHVLHLATVKETPESAIDVAVKGLYWLLEACRRSASLERFVLIGGDASVGHCSVPHDLPVTESQPHSPYPGVYALTKVLEEVMLEQYYIQYDLRGACLRAPWIQEKDDLRYGTSFGEDVFGGIRWRDYVGPARADEYAKAGAAALMYDADGRPVLRNFVHVEDLVSAILIALDHPAAHQQTFNICMDEPVDYGKLGTLLGSRGVPTVPVTTTFVSNWLDNAKARFLLGWRPEYDLERLVDEAWSYRRSPDDPRRIWYPG